MGIWPEQATSEEDERKHIVDNPGPASPHVYLKNAEESILALLKDLRDSSLLVNQQNNVPLTGAEMDLTETALTEEFITLAEVYPLEVSETNGENLHMGLLA